jgi:hypothetical protein
MPSPFSPEFRAKGVESARAGQADPGDGGDLGIAESGLRRWIAVEASTATVSRLERHHRSGRSWRRRAPIARTTVTS